MADESKFADVPLRVKTWGYIVAALVLALLHPICLLLFIAFISFWGQLELFKFAMPKIKQAVLWCCVNVAIQVVIMCYSTNYILAVLYLLLYFLGSTFFIFIKYNEYSRFYSTLVLYTVSICVLWYIGSPHQGYKLLIVLIVPIELNDIFQYLSGKVFGKHKIVPSISPNKTVEGLVGGILGFTLVFTSLFYALGFSMVWYKLILFAIVLSFLGFLGDVYFSFIKRQAHVKDTGNLLPGHGGLLDRLDSLLFTAPLFYFVML